MTIALIIFALATAGMLFLVLRKSRTRVLPPLAEMRAELFTVSSVPQMLVAQLEGPARAFWHMHAIPWLYHRAEAAAQQFRTYAGRLERFCSQGVQQIRVRRLRKERTNAHRAPYGEYWNGMLEWKNKGAGALFFRRGRRRNSRAHPKDNADTPTS